MKKTLAQKLAEATIIEGKVVTKFELEDVGVDHPDYFGGKGVAYTKWDEVYIGMGDSAYAAGDDAAEQMGSAGIETSADLDRALTKLSKKVPSEIEKNDELKYYVAIYINSGKSKDDYPGLDQGEAAKNEGFEQDLDKLIDSLYKSWEALKKSLQNEETTVSDAAIKKIHRVKGLIKDMQDAIDDGMPEMAESDKPAAPEAVQSEYEKLYKEAGSIHGKKQALWSKYRQMDPASPEKDKAKKEIDKLLDQWNAIQAKMQAISKKYSVSYSFVRK